MSEANRQKSVCVVATSYPQSENDWKSVFIKRILHALAARPELSLSAWLPRGPLPETVDYLPSPSDERWLGHLLEKGGIANVLRKGRPLDRLRMPAGLLRRLRAAYRTLPGDMIVHANWLQTAIPLGHRPNPLLVTVLGSDFKILRLPLVARTLHHVFSHRKTLIAPNANWMRPELERRFGACAVVHPVHFGVDRGCYSVTRRETPENRRRWLTVSRVTAAKIGPLFDWFRHCAPPDAELHLVGPLQENLALPDWVRFHGPVDLETLRNDWFPEVAGLISLSDHSEGLPQIFLEAMAAGLPVIASDLPAHREVIKHGISGFVVNGESEFERALHELSKAESNRTMGTAARKTIASEFGTWDDCAERYLNAYEYLNGPLK